MINKIILVGPMGAGKTTVGKLLAGHLGCQFKDTDHVIESRAGADLSWIFDVEGEAGFRQRESGVLEDLLAGEEPMVLATGGGVVLSPENRRLLREWPSVVYLTAPLEQLISRTQRDRRRPLLQVSDPAAKVRELYTIRDPLYREVSSCIVDTDHSHPKAAVTNIVRALGLSPLRGDLSTDESG